LAYLANRIWVGNTNLELRRFVGREDNIIICVIVCLARFLCGVTFACLRGSGSSSRGGARRRWRRHVCAPSIGLLGSLYTADVLLNYMLHVGSSHLGSGRHVTKGQQCLYRPCTH
jgi:hypothetical protein